MQYTQLLPNQYPSLLKGLKKQPPYMYIAGAPIPSDDYKFLCVVGSRKYDNYGEEACFELIRGLRNYPVVIVSGLALGVDSLAHLAALEYGLKTIAIPGSGLHDDYIYPREHLPLAKRIVLTGNTLLSPFEPDQGGDTWTFPVRNQLMAAISDATLVIEGGKESGTLLTAKNTLEIDRPLMFVPGSIFSDLSYGPHSLSGDGGILVSSSEDILGVLGFDVAQERTDRTKSKLEAALRDLPDDQKIVLRELQFKPYTSSELIGKLGISAVHFGIIATQLELHGLVTESNGVYRISVK